MASLPFQAPRRPFTQIPSARCIRVFLLVFLFYNQIPALQPSEVLFPPEGDAAPSRHWGVEGEHF